MKDISAAALLELALDLTHCLVKRDRFQQLLSTVRRAIPCDAVALLQQQGTQLKPLALQGLTRDTLGRRFEISEHPRFEVLCQARSAVVFPADTPLPDPYDGLLLAKEGELPVHACMGIPLLAEGRLMGLLTLDSLTPGVFDNIARQTLDIIAGMASATLQTAMLLEQLESRTSHSREVVAELTREALARDGGELIGDSPAMQHLQEELQMVAPSDFTVLITGETGVGKELVARTLHQRSLRRSAPLVYVNCAALPENLIESELFGHVRGAFTGADRDREGKFSIADGGTLFLDEIGELPLSAQSKLLRALQSREIQPVGLDQVKTIDVRILAATNRDLAQEVKQGRYRADLYHRLSVYPVNVPPLRARTGDIQLLTGYFMEQIQRKLGIQQLKLKSGIMAHLNAYDWPGNVRELEHMITRAALRARIDQPQQTIISLGHGHFGDLSPSRAAVSSTTDSQQSLPDASVPGGLKAATENFQRQLIREALELEQGNWAAAARRLQMDRANLNRLAKRLNITLKKTISIQ